MDLTDNGLQNAISRPEIDNGDDGVHAYEHENERERGYEALSYHTLDASPPYPSHGELITHHHTVLTSSLRPIKSLVRS